MTPEERDSYRVIQDFYSKRAIAHASFLVASIFGLFTILSILRGMMNEPWNLARTFLVVSYWGVWAFGAYSFLNFGYYASLSHDALLKIARDQNDSLIKDSTAKHQIPVKWFFELKAGREHAGWVRRHNVMIVSFLYIVLGIFLFFAVL